MILIHKTLRNYEVAPFQPRSASLGFSSGHGRRMQAVSVGHIYGPFYDMYLCVQSDPHTDDHLYSTIHHHNSAKPPVP